MVILSSRKIQISVIGSEYVGKSSLLNRYINNSFNPIYSPTFEEVFTSPTYPNISYIDTSGSHEYERLRPLSYVDVDYFLLCFSLDNECSFRDLVDVFIPEIQYYKPNCRFSLLGLKCDLNEELDGVESEAKSFNVDHYFKCSSKKGMNIDLLFETIESQLMNDVKSVLNTNFQQTSPIKPPSMNSFYSDSSTYQIIKQIPATEINQSIFNSIPSLQDQLSPFQSFISEETLNSSNQTLDFEIKSSKLATSKKLKRFLPFISSFSQTKETILSTSTTQTIEKTLISSLTQTKESSSTSTQTKESNTTSSSSTQTDFSSHNISTLTQTIESSMKKTKPQSTQTQPHPDYEKLINSSYKFTPYNYAMRQPAPSYPLFTHPKVIVKKENSNFWKRISGFLAV